MQQVRDRIPTFREQIARLEFNLTALYLLVIVYWTLFLPCLFVLVSFGDILAAYLRERWSDYLAS